MEVIRKGIYKRSCDGFITHGGKVIAFRDTKQVNSFKRKYFNLYAGLRLPDDCLYSRNIITSHKTAPYEIIPPSELKARDDYWREFFENGKQFKEGAEEPYGDGIHYLSLNG